MAKFFQIVAVMLIGAVLGSTQCLERCSFLWADHQAKTSQAAEFDMPCHHESGEQDSQLPASDSPCSYREFVADKLSKMSSSDDLQTIFFFSVRDVAQIIPLPVISPLVVVDETFPRFNPRILSPILRV